MLPICMPLLSIVTKLLLQLHVYYLCSCFNKEQYSNKINSTEKQTLKSIPLTFSSTLTSRISSKWGLFFRIGTFRPLICLSFGFLCRNRPIFYVSLRRKSVCKRLHPSHIVELRFILPQTFHRNTSRVPVRHRIPKCMGQVRKD